MIKIGAGSLYGFDGNKEGRLKTFLILLIGCLLLSGCSQVGHLDQLLTLKDLADEQEKLNTYIEQQDKNFDLILKEVEAGTLDQYPNKKKILRAFGEPVFARDAIEEGQELESWLYRYATQYFGGPKVYLYFDAEGNLVKSEYVEGKDGEIGEETTPEDGREKI